MKINNNIIKPGLTLVVLLMSACSGDDQVLATVNGEDITSSQFNAYLEFKRIKVRDDKHHDAALDQFLEREALSQVIEDKYDDAMELKAKTELDEFRRQMNISRYFENHLKDAVDDQKVKNFYVANEDKYSQKQMNVAHVLFRLKRDMDEAQRKAKLTTANEAYAKIKSGKDFSKIAKDYSEDRVSAKKGGDLGWLKQGSIDAKFSKKIFAMKKGDVSEPFETSFGYHIVKIIEEPKTVKKAFEAVKGDIRYQLRQQVKEAELKSLKQAIKIVKKD